MQSYPHIFLENYCFNFFVLDNIYKRTQQFLFFLIFKKNGRKLLLFCYK